MWKPSNIFHILLLLSIDVATMPSLPFHPDHSSSWWKEQEARQSLIQTVCQKNAQYIPHGLGQSGVNKFSYSESYNLLFCRNQKVGSATWLVRNFRYLLGIPEDDLKRLDIGKWYAWTLDKFRIEDEEKLRSLFETAVTFSVVRHPFERLVSAYQDKILDEESALGQRFRLHHGDPSFAKLVDFVIKGGINDNFNIHWEPYVSSCNYCSFKYTVISKMETFEEDREMILRMVGAEDVVSRSKKILNKVVGKNIEEVSKALFSELTIEEGEALADIYKYDLEMFGYDADIYLDMTNQEYKRLG